ncbi:MAG: hypothetical protein WD716_01230 [Fimbriimonadaceae bacterium]
MILALTLACGLSLPKEAKELEGLYVLGNGYGVTTIELKPEGGITKTDRFDHPGVSVWEGSWQFDKVTLKLKVLLRYAMKEEGKVVAYTWVPLVWGDRLILADEEELIEGIVAKRFRTEVERLNDLGERDSLEMGRTNVAVRIKRKEDKLPHRYGKILAPKEFEKQFEGINLRLPN